MALWDWWTPFSYGGIGTDEQSQIEMLNNLIPFLQPAEQAAAARYISQQRGGDQDLRNMVPAGYGSPSTGGVGSEANWLQGLSSFARAVNQSGDTRIPGAPWFGDWKDSMGSLEGGVDTEWFKGLGDVARQLSPNATRQQQNEARSAFDRYLGSAPNEMMRTMGQYFLDPTLTSPRYGSAALFGSYQNPYSIKGGLVSNPWYTG